jgi:DNA-binding response OmpR family regulator
MMPTAKTTILIIDADRDLANELAEQISAQSDFGAEIATTGADGLAALACGKYGLIIIDAALPDMAPSEICRAMRLAGEEGPIVVLSPQDGDALASSCLAAGASDCLTKPYKFSTLLTRLRAHLRNRDSSEDAVFGIGPYEFHPLAKRLTQHGGRRIRLTEKEADILKYLYHAGAKPVPRDELLREVWGYNANVDTHTLETHIYRLRQKIEEDAAAPRMLLTETGGYRLAP